MSKKRGERELHKKFTMLVRLLPSITLISILSLTLAPFPTQVIAPPTETYEKYGPRADNILIKVYLAGREAEFNAFKAGEIDVIDWPLDKATYDTIKNDPNFAVAPLTMFDMYNLEMNCMKWPTSDVWFRRAIAHLIDKTTFYLIVLNSFSGVMLDTPIAPEWTQWYNDYTAKYPYDPPLASQILEAHGYKEWDTDGLREWKAPNGTVFELPSLLFYIRSDDPDRQEIGTWVAYEMAALGLPVDRKISPKNVCWNEVMRMPYNYHLYTGGWGPWRDPDYLYDMYHSDFGKGWLPKDWANNYVFFDNATYDTVAEQIKFAPNIPSAIAPVMQAQAILMDQVPMVPLWHSAGYQAWGAKYRHWTGEEKYWDQKWTGIVNSRVISGFSNPSVNCRWAFMNAHTEGFEKGTGKLTPMTIRYGFMTPADVFNPVHADFYWDWEVLDKIYDYLVLANPFTGEDIPWMAKEYSVETWNNAGTPATKITFKLFNNILWSHVDKTTGNVVVTDKFTSADVKFTIQFMKDAFSPLFYYGVADVDHIDTPDLYTAVVYYKIQSCWALHWLGGFPMIPKHIWEPIGAPNSRTGGEFETTGKLTSCGPFLFVDKGLTSVLLKANPTYFRKLVRPDYYSAGQPVPTHDGDVDIDDFGMAVGHYGDAYPWPTSPPGAHDVDPWADVNKDLVIELDDVMEIGVRYLKTEYYPYHDGYPNYYGP